MLFFLFFFLFRGEFHEHIRSLRLKQPSYCGLVLSISVLGKTCIYWPGLLPIFALRTIFKSVLTACLGLQIADFPEEAHLPDVLALLLLHRVVDEIWL